MGCLKLTYQNNTELKIISSKKELTYNKSNNKGYSSYLFGFNGQEKDNETYGDGNAYDFGARIYDGRLGRWMSVDPYMNKYPAHSPYVYVGNTPTLFIDIKGEEPGLNRSGSIEDAIKQWRKSGLKNPTMNQIADWIRSPGDIKKIRYVYTEEKGWIDLVHYFKSAEYGEVFDLTELASNYDYESSTLINNAGPSYYSYEDLPSNDFGAHSNHTKKKEVPSTNPYSSEPVLKDVALTGDELFKSVQKHFDKAGATQPKEAPNYNKLPKDHGDRKRLPEIKGYHYIPNPLFILIPTTPKFIKIPIKYTKEEKKELLKTGEYVPQNHTDKPLDLSDFDAAKTSNESMQKNENESPTED